MGLGLGLVHLLKPLQVVRRCTVPTVGHLHSVRVRVRARARARGRARVRVSVGVRVGVRVRVRSFAHLHGVRVTPGAPLLRHLVRVRVRVLLWHLVRTRVRVRVVLWHLVRG